MTTTMSTITLTGPRVTWREVLADDAADLCRIIALPEVWRFVTDEEPPNPDQFGQYITTLAEERAAEPRTGYKLTLVHDGRIVGTGGVNLTPGPARCAEIGYLLDSAAWGSGLGTEAAALLRDFAFDDLGLHRIEATTAPDNPGSQRVLEKIGMVREGVKRDAVYRHGQWRDSVLFGMVNPAD